MTARDPIDFAELRRSLLPNQADLVSPVFSDDADRLLQRVSDLIESEPRVTLLATFDRPRQIQCVACSATLGFPDDIWIQVDPHGSGGAVLSIYSRARLGIYDFGVNRRRIADWIARLQTAQGVCSPA